MCTITSDHFNLEQDDLAVKFIQQLAITNDEPAAAKQSRSKQACSVQSSMLMPVGSEATSSDPSKRGRGGPSTETPDAKKNRALAEEMEMDSAAPAHAK